MGFHAAVLAHQGGWDEILLVAAPMALVVFLIRLARKRADTIQTERKVPAKDADADRR